jgi:hypothetical protein
MSVLSYEGRVLFVHIQKTAGLTVRDVMRRHYPDWHQPFGWHKHAIEVRDRLGTSEWQRFYKFTFVRNPSRRQVSWFHHVQERRARGGNIGRVQECNLPEHCTFEQFVEGGSGVLVCPQFDYITDRLGNLIIDDVYRFENFDGEVQRLGARLGITPGPWPHKNATEHRAYQEYYSPILRDIVGGRFARDIEAFGYKFDP